MAATAHAVEGTPTGRLPRVLAGIGGLGLGAAVGLVAQLTIVPVALAAWGAGPYGEWILLTGLVTLLKFSDLGLQTYVVNRLCELYVREDRPSFRRLLRGVLGVQCLLALVGLGLAVAWVVGGSPESTLHLRTVTGLQARAVLALLAFELLLGVPMGLVGGVYRATGHLARAARIGAAQQAVLLVVTVALLLLRASFLELAGARVALALLWALWVLRDVTRLHPWLGSVEVGGAWRQGLAMVAPSLFFLLLPLADYFGTQLTNLAVQVSLAPVSVARLATHRTIANFAQLLCSLVTFAVWPELTALHARGERAQMGRTVRTLVKLNGWTAGLATFGLLPVVPFLYGWWTAGRLELDVPTLAILMARTLVWSTWSSAMAVTLATNRHRPATLAQLGASVATAGLAWMLVPVFGIRGAALAGLVADAATVAWIMPVLAARITGDRPGELAREVWRSVGGAVVVPAAAGALAWSLVPSPPLRYGAVLPLALAGALGMAWRALSGEERAVLTHLVPEDRWVRWRAFRHRGARAG